ncbi:hypothetical protein [Kutzneria buriramensis]|uniref:DUF4345 domain-containing protein n=1 Tax=Kutzneria buriramensis TaxID=1045776 RepID=A0A3E0HFP1_9PSEU|nr:hypothetical protein [Kutzneria buriramensis]REH44539.1 hypothetical protein BCF44_10819 [Kutzneria buriramensis]
MTRYAAAVLLAASGYIHADLYLHGYRAIPLVGPAFLLQASGSFAIALLLLLGNVFLLRLAAAGLAAGALVGFALSRTVGIGTFIERGLDPAPQALLSLLAEVGVLVLLAIPLVAKLIRTPQPSTAGASSTS